MLTDNHIKEGLSRAYILAVAHKAGLSCGLAASFDYGIDGTLIDIQVKDGVYSESGWKIDFQAKASTNYTLTATDITYKLEARAYNILIHEAHTPRILVFMALPKKADDWLTVTANSLSMQKCAWWMSIRGQEATKNTKTVSIKIPIDNKFDTSAVTGMMERLKVGGMP
jgi:hypothetical protein